MLMRSETASQLVLKSCHPALELKHLHIKGGLLAPESCDLLLKPSILLLLMREVALDILFYLKELVSEGFADILGL